MSFEPEYQTAIDTPFQPTGRKSSALIFPRVDRKMGIYPWYGLKVFNTEGMTYEANVKPLTDVEVIRVKTELTAGDPHRLGLLEGLAKSNRELLERSGTIGVVLDGRLDCQSDGWLGDMVEATRLVSPILEAGKKVALYTPHADLFMGSSQESLQVFPYAPDIPGKPLYPWNREVREFVGQKSHGQPVLFPLNAAVPVLTQFTLGGDIINEASIEQLREAIRPNSIHHGIMPRQYDRIGMHQLQAMQFMADMIGIDGARLWKEFPPAYIHPAADSIEKAAEVCADFLCESDRRKLYIHPGVASSMGKTTSKLYPGDKWAETIKTFRTLSDQAPQILLFTPIDSEQARMTEDLARTSNQRGFEVVQLPMSDLREDYDWNLGTFAAFLANLGSQKTVIAGVDSMPAGHMGPAMGLKSVVLGSQVYSPAFFCPQKDALIVMPQEGPLTSGINPEHAAWAIAKMMRR